MFKLLKLFILALSFAMALTVFAQEAEIPPAEAPVDASPEAAPPEAPPMEEAPPEELPSEAVPPEESPVEDPVVGEAPAEETVPPTDMGALADEPAPEDDEKKFGKFTVSPQVGYVYYPEATYKFDQIQLKVDQRSAFSAKIHLDLGGDGLAFEIAPLFSVEKIGGSFSDISDLAENANGGVEGTFIALGGQMGLAFRGSWGSFYPHLGIGFHGAYLMGDNIEYGAEIYGRIPAGFTWYTGKHFALVAEVAFMYGVTGIRGKVPDNMDAFYAELEATAGIDAETAQNMTQEELIAEVSASAMSEDDAKKILQDQISDTIKFGNGYAFEFMVGVRFP